MMNDEFFGNYCPKANYMNRFQLYVEKNLHLHLKKPVHKELHNMHKYEVKAVTYLSTRETSKVFKI